MSWHGRRGKDRLTKVRNGRQGAEGNRSAGNRKVWCSRAATGWLGTAEHSCFWNGRQGEVENGVHKQGAASIGAAALARHGQRGQASIGSVITDWQARTARSGKAWQCLGRIGRRGEVEHSIKWSVAVSLGMAAMARLRLELQDEAWRGRAGEVWSGVARQCEKWQARLCVELPSSAWQGTAATATQCKSRRSRARQGRAGKAGVVGRGEEQLGRQSYATAQCKQLAAEGVDVGRPPPARDSSADSSASNAPQLPDAAA